MFVPPSCTICGHPQEDINHLLFQCNIAISFWDKVYTCKPFLSTQDRNNSNKDNWMYHWQNNKEANIYGNLTWESFYPFCLWHIWCNRNSNIFNNKKDQVNLEEVIGRVLEFISLQDTKRGPQFWNTETIQVKWEKPRPSFTKLNTDGVVKDVKG